MGTNYYLETDFCKGCGKPKKVIHIGKSSCGWKFLFQRQEGLTTINDVKRLIQKGIIRDEYGETISTAQFLDLVESKQKEQHHQGFSVGGYDFIDGDFS